MQDLRQEGQSKRLHSLAGGKCQRPSVGIVRVELGEQLLLFLGAGASKPLGIPTMEDFTEIILHEILTDPKSLKNKIYRENH